MQASLVDFGLLSKFLQIRYKHLTNLVMIYYKMNHIRSSIMIINFKLIITVVTNNVAINIL